MMIDFGGERTTEEVREQLYELVNERGFEQTDHGIPAKSEKVSTDIEALVRELATEITQGYPQASVSVESDEQITATVLPSFGRAIAELMVNAAEHGGETPTITVTIDTVPNAVEIRIRDDGPGLASHEANVFNTGTEVPPDRGSGSGLWLAHWIVAGHGGFIQATDTTGGTTLTVTVPKNATTDPEQPSRRRDQYRLAFEKAGDGMTITDDEGHILEINEEAARIYGLDRQRLLGRSIGDFLPESFDFEAEWGEIQAGAMKRDEMPIVSADGGVSAIEYTAKSDFLPGQHLIVSRDITERKERELELEGRIARLDKFADVLSHDLRNPLNVAQGRLELAQEEFDSEHFEVIERSHDRMDSLITDLLTLARGGSAVTDIEPVALTVTAQECWANVETREGGLSVEVDRPILADRSRLMQMFENLFGNAIEHGGEDVSVTVGTLDGGFYVEDDGRGIPEEERDRVFEDGYSSRTHGTGFGLSIVGQGVEAHGWDIRVTESASGGARFEITGVEFGTETDGGRPESD